MVAMNYYSLTERWGILLLLLVFVVPDHCHAYTNDNEKIPSCRTYCGNITVNYPFATKHGCGDPNFKDLLYCINNVLMLHIPSGTYRVLEIDYAYQTLTLHDPHLSTCDNIVLGGKGNGFVIDNDSYQSPQLTPDPDNVFLLIGCSAQSPLFQGFPDKHLTCRNVSGMSCEDYYRCPAWGFVRPKEMGSVYGSGPPECCAVSYQSIKAVNLTKLGCQGYSSAYSLAPLQLDGPRSWSYGIRVRYSLRNDAFCKVCEATGGTCGFDGGGGGGVNYNDKVLCLCGTWNSTTNCDGDAANMYSGTTSSLSMLKFEWLLVVALWTMIYGHPRLTIFV